MTIVALDSWKISKAAYGLGLQCELAVTFLLQMAPKSANAKAIIYYYGVSDYRENPVIRFVEFLAHIRRINATIRPMGYEIHCSSRAPSPLSDYTIRKIP